MKKEIGHQKIKCSVTDCTHNCTPEKVCSLNEISVCNCKNEKTTDPLKGTACASYKYQGEHKI